MPTRFLGVAAFASVSVEATIVTVFASGAAGKFGSKPNDTARGGSLSAFGSVGAQRKTDQPSTFRRARITESGQPLRTKNRLRGRSHASNEKPCRQARDRHLELLDTAKAKPFVELHIPWILSPKHADIVARPDM